MSTRTSNILRLALKVLNDESNDTNNTQDVKETKITSNKNTTAGLMESAKTFDDVTNYHMTAENDNEFSADAEIVYPLESREESEEDTPNITFEEPELRKLSTLTEVVCTDNNKNQSNEVIENVSSYDHEDSDDSVEDRDYEPSIEDNNSDSSENNETATGEVPENQSGEEIRNNGSPEPIADKQSKVRSRKRQSKPHEWKRNITKKRRDAGLEFTTASNRTIATKQVKALCKNSCKLNCRDSFSEDTRKLILSNFWSEDKSVDLKRQFVASCVEQIPIRRTRERTGDRQGKRQFSNKYSLEVNGQKIRVCKIFFQNTLCISQTFVDTAIMKKKDGGVTTSDARGKKEPSNKISEVMRNEIRSHILKFPVYQSHYSRERSDRKYLGNHLNIHRMYNLFIEYCNQRGLEEIPKEWLYSKIFNSEFNYSFQHPDNDTCDQCDKYLLELREASTAETRAVIQFQYDDHLADASNRYKLKSLDKTHARECRNEKVVMVDLEKCLPTPDLHNSQSFYCLKLWTFNFTIHDSTDNETHCMMWDETIAGRGGNELASCLLKWSESFSDDLQVLTIWSDNCPSQNRNFIIVVCYMWLMKQHPNIKMINHKYLVRGHTHLEADSDHSLIERERKKVPKFQVITPWYWQQLVRLCTSKRNFVVNDMNTEDFKNFKTLFEGLAAPYVSRKKSEGGDDFLISSVVHLQVRAESIGVLFYKTKFSDAEFKQINLNRQSRRSVCPEELPQIRNALKPVSDQKYNHLQRLSNWIPKRFHDFYKNIPHAANAENDEDRQ